MRDEDIDLQPVPLYLHRMNTVKQAIQTFRNDFIAGLISSDKTPPCIYGID